jgi:hypothetical protein
MQMVFIGCILSGFSVNIDYLMIEMEGFLMVFVMKKKIKDF